MVSFSCEVCNDTVIKKKLDQHRQRCHGAYFTCIDCSNTFSGTDYRNHTQCISEAEKYEKSLYRGKKTDKAGNSVTPQSKTATESKKSESKKTESKKTESKKSEKTSESKKSKSDKKSASKLGSVDLTKYSGGSLYKVVKSLAKDMHKDKKDVLKKLQVSVADGKLVVSL